MENHSEDPKNHTLDTAAQPLRGEPFIAMLGDNARQESSGTVKLLAGC